MRFPVKLILKLAMIAACVFGFVKIAAIEASAQGPATAVVRKTNDRIQSLLRENVPEGSKEEKELEERLAAEVRTILDARELGRRALRDHLDSLSSKQLREFETLLGSLIERSYVQSLLEQPDYRVEYVKEERGNDSRQVSTQLHTTRRGEPYTFEIVYQLHRRAGKWRVYDVVTDGVSLIRNYRSQFNRIIAEEGYSGLLARMRKRRRELQKPPAPP